MAKRTKKTSGLPAGPDIGLRRKIPALDSYLTRIGAEELNFRRFMVKEYRGGDNYYLEKTIINVNIDGTIYCSRGEHQPTDEERKGIAEGFVRTDVPKSIGTSDRAADAYAAGIKNELYRFYDRRTNLVVMLQEKWVRPDGGKVYIPHSPWSDGAWRRMEPDGPLPFWKPSTDRKKGRKMIHEGAKAAAFVDRLVNDPEYEEHLRAHPWGADMAKYEHWGMIGGALAPHRSDYTELLREKPTEVVYVSDNDYSGESALQVVSRCYGESLVGIRFGAEFPPAWDMADPVPEKLFVGKGTERRYRGRRLRDMMKPATWATEVLPNPLGKGRSITVMRRAFLEEWVHSVRPEVYIHKDWPYEMWLEGEFNSIVRPFSNVDDTARLVKGDDASKAAVIRYDPSKPPGIYMDKATYVNTHVPTDVVKEVGDPAPFEDFMRHLVPDPSDRLELERWCATLIARPTTKMTYGVLLISETQGVGKGTLGEKILAPLVGHFNVSYPGENEIVDSDYNYWLAHRRLAVVHEIYAGHSSKAYNRLKSIITDRRITVMKKFVANYEIDNWIHIFACSNSFRAIKISMDDRRWLLPKITDAKRDSSYWIEFNRWLSERGGLGIIRTWADEFLRTHDPVLEGAESPWTTVKREVVEEGYSPGMQLVANTLDRIKSVIAGEEEADVAMRDEWRRAGMLGPRGEVVLVDVQLVRLITDVIYQGRSNDRLEKPLTIRKLAKGMGWHAGTDKVSTGMRDWGAEAHNGLVISNYSDVAGLSPALLGGKKGEGNGHLRLRPLKLDWVRGM